MMIRSIAAALMAGLILIAPVGVERVEAQGFFGAPRANSVDDKAVVSFPSQYRPGEVIVSFGDRRLYHVISRGRAMSYPIAIPRPESRWDGVLRVTQKRKNPTWTPTASMRRENPDLPRVVPGGHPRNPMGVRALYLGSTLYRIHGTDAPWTIGRNVSRGCIRMHNEHVVELYERVGVGAKVTATWKRFRSQQRVVSAQSSSSQTEFVRSVFGLN